MTYRNIDRLTQDAVFGGRVRACTVEQAQSFQNDARPDFVALANDTLRGGGATTLTFIRMIAAFPGLAPDGDDTEVPDGDLLAQVQANWQIVAALFFNDDGSMRNGGTP